MRTFLLSLILLFNISTFCQSTQRDSIKARFEMIEKELASQTKKIEENERKLSYQEGQINSQTGMLDTAFDGVSAEVGASANSLTIAIALFSLFAIVLAIFVADIERNIRRIMSDSEDLALRNLKTRKQIEDLSKLITQDPKGLYGLLKKEESDHLVNRLIEVPEDIENLSPLLLSRDLDNSYFQKIKEAFLRADAAHKDKYYSLFFQHFADLAIVDADVSPGLLQDLPNLIEYSFKNDIIKSSKDYFAALQRKSISNSVTEINAFARALSGSRYQTLGDIYVYIYRQFSRANKFLIYQLVEKSDDTEVFRENYGRLLLDFVDATPNEEETNILTEIQVLIQEDEQN